MSNVKIERYNHTFAEEISRILMTEVKDTNVKFVTITACDISSDLSTCKVYFTVFDVEKKEAVSEALRKGASFIRGKLSTKVNIRHTPELRFIYDESVAYGNKIENIIKEINEEKGA